MGKKSKPFWNVAQASTVAANNRITLANEKLNDVKNLQASVEAELQAVNATALEREQAITEIISQAAERAEKFLETKLQTSQLIGLFQDYILPKSRNPGDANGLTSDSEFVARFNADVISGAAEILEDRLRFEHKVMRKVVPSLVMQHSKHFKGKRKRVCNVPDRTRNG